MGRGIGVIDGISGGLETYHGAVGIRVWGCLKGPTFLPLPTCTVGISSRGGGDGGGRALSLPLPLGQGSEFDGKPLPLAMPVHVLGLLPVKPRGSIPTLPRGIGGEGDPLPPPPPNILYCLPQHSGSSHAPHIR